MLKLLMLSKK